MLDFFFPPQGLALINGTQLITSLGAEGKSRKHLFPPSDAVFYAVSSIGKLKKIHVRLGHILVECFKTQVQVITLANQSKLRDDIAKSQ